MRVLVDTNIIISNLQSTREDHELVKSALRLLVLGGWELCISAVQVYEFWSVATRSAASRGGLGLECAAAEKQIDRLLEAYTLLPEPADVVHRWKKFCVTNDVRGNRCHDARIAVLAGANGIGDILTQNIGDFEGWPGVSPLAPVDV